MNRHNKKPRKGTVHFRKCENSGHARACTLDLCGAAGVGFVFFLMELVWYRLLGPLLGGTTYTFGLILCVALAGIGLGSAAYARFFHTPRYPSSLAGVCGLEALLMAFPLAMGDRLALWTAELHAANSGRFSDEVWGWAAIAALVILPAALVSGWEFPADHRPARPGQRPIGQAGGPGGGLEHRRGDCGSLAGGFGLLPLLSAPVAARRSDCWLCQPDRAVFLVARLGGTKHERRCLAVGHRGRGNRPRLRAGTHCRVAA